MCRTTRAPLPRALQEGQQCNATSRSRGSIGRTPECTFCALEKVLLYTLNLILVFATCIASVLPIQNHLAISSSSYFQRYFQQVDLPRWYNRERTLTIIELEGVAINGTHAHCMNLFIWASVITYIWSQCDFSASACITWMDLGGGANGCLPSQTLALMGSKVTSEGMSTGQSIVGHVSPARRGAQVYPSANSHRGQKLNYEPMSTQQVGQVSKSGLKPSSTNQVNKGSGIKGVFHAPPQKETLDLPLIQNTVSIKANCRP